MIWVCNTFALDLFWPSLNGLSVYQSSFRFQKCSSARPLFSDLNSWLWWSIWRCQQQHHRFIILYFSVIQYRVKKIHSLLLGLQHLHSALSLIFVYGVLFTQYWLECWVLCYYRTYSASASWWRGRHLPHVTIIIITISWHFLEEDSYSDLLQVPSFGYW